MESMQDPRVAALRDALHEEVHGLWISNEMAVNNLKYR